MVEFQKKKIPRKIDPFRNEGECRTDLERYRLMAIELGASDAKVIKSCKVVIEDRVRGKCMTHSVRVMARANTILPIHHR